MKENLTDLDQTMQMGGTTFRLFKHDDGHTVAIPEDPEWLIKELAKIEPPKELPKRFR